MLMRMPNKKDWLLIATMSCVLFSVVAGVVVDTFIGTAGLIVSVMLGYMYDHE